MFEECGYEVSYELLNAWDFGIAQERKRVIIVGYRKDLNKVFDFQNLEKIEKPLVLGDILKDLPEPLPALEKNKTNGDSLEIPNHEYFIGDFLLYICQEIEGGHGKSQALLYRQVEDMHQSILHHVLWRS